MNNLLSRIKNKRFRRRNGSSSSITSNKKSNGKNCGEEDDDEDTLTTDLHQKSPSFTTSRLKLRFDDDDDDDENFVEQQKPSCSADDEDLGSSTNENYHPKPRLQRDLKDTLSDPTSLGYFLTYMERRGLRHLVKFWLDAETFRLAGKSMLERMKIEDGSKKPENCHLISLIEQDAVAIFAKYLSKESSYDIGLTEQLRNDIINKICCENGRLDLDCFVTAQNFILNIMQIRYYPDYLRSVLYCKHVLEVLDQRQNLAITDILYDETCLFHFVEFLEQENKLDLIEFWLAAKNFREKIEKQQNNQLSCQEDAMILYNKYFSLQSPRRLDIFDHRTRTKLEDEICKLDDPTVYGLIFERPCKMALNFLEKEYLPKFLRSKLFVKLYDEIAQASRDDLELPQAYSSGKKTKKSGSIGCSESSDSSLRIGDWSADDGPARFSTKIDDRGQRHSSGKSSQSSSSARLSIDDPDSLWKREKTKLTLGRIDNFGNYVTETEKPDFSFKAKKIDVDKVKDKMKKMVFGDAKEKELLAEQVAALIVQDIQNLTTMASTDDVSSF